MKVSDLKAQLEALPDDMDLRVSAPNAPPWITEFVIKPVDFVQEGDGDNTKSEESE